MFRGRSGYWCNLASFAALIAVNLAAAALPSGVRRYEAPSSGFQVLLTPGTYSFSIWLLIYGLLGGWVLYPLLRTNREPFSASPLPVNFLLSCILSIVWVTLGDQHPLLSLTALLLQVIVTASMYRRTRQILRPAAVEVWFVRLPFSLYFGWISLITLASIDTLWDHTRGHEGNLWQPGLTLFLLLVGLAVACLVGFRWRDAIIPLTFAWGYGAITAMPQPYRVVFIVSGAGALALVVYSLWISFLRTYERD
ncbi:MAG: hypothetical protein KZY74_18830 [Paenibacillaceae bacterium]|uniref:Tryptophan-rich sensory protein n=1 Tax=Paenibacillus mellifer TaxID=2937794 RepID=A0A9X1Y300_9BACL|nr:hypothetical protein [Paenibacillus mellifer]MBW4841446.1 hypothetical protein [Paenibacillaceae bacterium]MCK8489613.1 hypothetical protein [Paenibacillus mellifer]